MEGIEVQVPVKWIYEIQGTLRGKTKPHCLKLMMNGIYEASDLRRTTSVILINTPVGRDLEGTSIYCNFIIYIYCDDCTKFQFHHFNAFHICC